MNILFINPVEGAEYAKPPLGLLSVATVCQDAGHDVTLIDRNVDRLHFEDIEHYDLIGITAMTPNILEAQLLATQIKELYPCIPIVLGGVHASIFPDECLKLGCFDIVVQGEGETPILNILNDFNSNAGAWRVYSGYFSQYIPIPNYSLINISKYHPRYPHAIATPWVPASTSRGCPYKCSFCDKAVSGGRYHSMPADSVIKMIRQLKEVHKVKDITFYDDMFTLDIKRVTAICDGIGKYNISWTCESRVNFSNLGMLQNMQGAGCRMIYYGIESGNQQILDNLNKGIRIPEIKRAVDNTHKAGIKAAGYFMLGCPGETKETIKQTVKFARDIGLDHAQFSVCIPLPGSDLYKEYLWRGNPVPEWGHFQYLADDSLKPMFTTDELSREYIEESVDEANKEWAR